MNKESKDLLIQIHNELQQIYVRGVDSIHMANALVQIENLISTDEEIKEEPTAD